MPINCFDCGEEGHVAAYCPNRDIDTCGHCDPATHLVSTPDGPRRCPRCHPKRDELRRPLTHCSRCHQVIYEWDHEPCGHHSAPHTTDQRLPREQIEQIISRD